MASMNPELVQKFFGGKCTPEEVHQVLIWINSKEGAIDLAKEFEKFETDGEVNFSTSQDMLAKIHERINDAKDERSFGKNGGEKSIRNWSKILNRSFTPWKRGIAVSLALTIMASVIWLLSGRREENLPEPSTTQVEYLTKQTRSGEKLTLKLTDGSIIHINSNSTVRFPKAFTGPTREVYMEGQVFFDVQRDENKPFIVHSNGLITSVLGTSFAITEDSASQRSEVAVLTGKVKVAKTEMNGTEGSEELNLDPMDAARLDVVERSFEKIKVDYDNVFAWKDNVIVFQNASFDDVQIRLEKWFGVKFQMKKKINPRKDYTGRFEDQTLEEILIGLSFTYDFDFTINDSNVIIR